MSTRGAHRRIHDFWSFYRHYTATAIHTAATAALAIFGILVFVDPLFAVLAICSYVVPPVVLYVRSDDRDLDSGSDLDGHGSSATDRPVESATTGSSTGRSSGEGRSRPRTNTDVGSGDTDSDSDGTDTDSDSDGRDSDTDSDSDDGDTDSDSDN